MAREANLSRRRKWLQCDRGHLLNSKRKVQLTIAELNKQSVDSEANDGRLRYTSLLRDCFQLSCLFWSQIKSKGRAFPLHLFLQHFLGTLRHDVLTRIYTHLHLGSSNFYVDVCIGSQRGKRLTMAAIGAERLSGYGWGPSR